MQPLGFKNSYRPTVPPRWVLVYVGYSPRFLRARYCSADVPSIVHPNSTTISSELKLAAMSYFTPGKYIWTIGSIFGRSDMYSSLVFTAHSRLFTSDLDCDSSQPTMTAPTELTLGCQSQTQPTQFPGIYHAQAAPLAFSGSATKRSRR